MVAANYNCIKVIVEVSKSYCSLEDSKGLKDIHFVGSKELPMLESIRIMVLLHFKFHTMEHINFKIHNNLEDLGSKDHIEVLEDSKIHKKDTIVHKVGLMVDLKVDKIHMVGLKVGIMVGLMVGLKVDKIHKVGLMVEVEELKIRIMVEVRSNNFEEMSFELGKLVHSYILKVDNIHHIQVLMGIN